MLCITPVSSALGSGCLCLMGIFSLTPLEGSLTLFVSLIYIFRFQVPHCTHTHTHAAVIPSTDQHSTAFGLIRSVNSSLHKKLSDKQGMHESYFLKPLFQ